MTQTSARNCTNCGAPLAPEQRFCSNCGVVQDAGTARPTELNTGGAANFHQAETASAVPPPPPPTPGYMSTASPPSSPYQQYQYEQAPYPGPQQYQSAPTPNYSSPAQPQPQQPLPSYATPMKDSSKGVLGQIGCGVVLVILLIMLACGGISYFAYTALKNMPSSTGTTYNSGSSGGSSSTTTTQPPITTTTFDAVRATVTYASVKITIVDVKQSKTFLDDSYASSNGMLRLDIKEQMPSNVNGSYAYSEIARLILPDGTSVQPVNAQSGTSPASGTSRNNWLDFPVSTNVTADQITLLFGVDAEQQIKLPLTGKADVSQYQDRSSTPNKGTIYHGLKWTITNATVSLSNNGKQAQKGMTFVLVTVRVDNPSSNYFTEYYGDYVRLKSGDITTGPTTDSTVPLSFDVGSSGKTGVAIFQVPPAAAYTFILLPDAASNVSQANIDFQV